MIRTAIDKLLETLLWIILATMALVMGANVLGRMIDKWAAYFGWPPPNLSLYWGDELAQILLVWLTFLGAAVAVRENENYYLNYATRKATGRALRWLVLLRDLLSILAILVLLWFSAIVAWQIQSWVMPATEISRALVYGACPIGCAFMLYYSLTGLMRHLAEPLAQLEPEIHPSVPPTHAE